MTKRTRRSIAGSVLVVLGLVIGAVIVTALQAEGRERSQGRHQRRRRVAAQARRGVRRPRQPRRSARSPPRVSVADPGSDFDVDQAPGIIVVHDRTTGVVTRRRRHASSASPTRPACASARTSTVHAVDGGALIVDRVVDGRVEADPRAAAVGRVDRRGRGRSSPARAPAASAATPDGHAVIADEAAGNVVFLRSRRHDRASAPTLELTDGVASITSLGARHGRARRPRRRPRAGHPRPRRRRSTSACRAPTATPSPVVLQQPGAAADPVVAATTDGRLVAIPLAGGDDRGARDRPARRRRADRADRRSGAACSPCRRRRRRSASGAPTAQGGWTEVQQAPLDGAGSELRLRLVNGWVWINDVDTGAAWVTSPQQRLDRVEDWGSILSQLDDDESDDNTDEDGGEVITEVNPDDPNAEIVQSDEIDEEGPNKPPIARDDEAQTRVDRPIDVDVLLNDTDPNGDVLVVAAVEPTGGDGPSCRSRRTAAACRCRRPPATSARSRSATRSPTAATRARRPGSRSQVAPSDGSANRPPEAHNDIASTRARPPDDVRRARQRRRPRRRRARPRLDRASRTRRPRPGSSCPTRPARSCSRRIRTRRRSASS